ncbi:thiol reductant ABC exporter subunit CydD [Paenibacillus sp. UNC451MF]|uniref:thiol reductant ABC exporter subunit CydD n=1 Tax=Paenibacillus sp. UNC451MF TaxID=1449063 RepID=UPI00048AD7BA|nr:thiol reductant ABC exporter subunit CydD [Paenibacillus sp. UNC451MF]
MMKKLLGRVSGTFHLLLISIGFSVVGGMLMILESASLARLVHDAFLEGLGVSSLLPIFGVLLGWIALRALIQSMSDYAASQTAMRIKSELRQQLLHKLVALGPNYAKGERSGELIGTIYEGVEQLEAYLARYLPQMALSMLIPAAIFCVTANLDWISAIVLAVTLPLLILFMILVGLAAKSKAQRQFERLGQLGGHFMDVLRGLTTLQIFNRSRAQIGIVSQISEEYRKTTMGTLRLAFLSSFVMEMFATLSTAIVAVFLGLRLISGEIGFEHAFLVLLLTPEFYAPVRALGTQFHASTNGMAAASRIISILEAGLPEPARPGEGLKLEAKPNGYRIEFRDVNLTYPGAASPALSKLTFTLEPGERIAVIGPTGSGKSSLLDVLQGFAPPTSGSVWIDGVNMSSLSMEDWRKQLSSVNQNPKLYYGTLRGNLTLGCTAPISDEHMAAVLQAAGVDFTNQLPDGMDTIMGESIPLSGGQIQRIAIARALLKDAPLLLLDEPTSGLDLWLEAVVRRGLDLHLHGRMSVTVAHRLETVQQADRIIVMNRGRIAEMGTPAELLAAGGLYARMMLALEQEKTEHDFIESSSGVWKEAQENEERHGNHYAKQDEDKSLSRRVEQGLLRRVLTFLRLYRGRMLAAVLLGCLTIGASIGLMGTSGYLIAQAALRPESVLLLWVPIVGVRFFGLSRGAFRYLERLVSHDLTFRILHQVRVWIYESLEPMGVRLLEKRRSGELLQSLISDVEQLQHMYLRVLAPPLIACVTGALGCILLAVHQVQLGLILMGMLMISGIGLPWLSSKLGREPGKAIARQQAQMYAQTSDLLMGMKDLLIFGQDQDRLSAIRHQQTQVNRNQTRANRVGAIVNGAMLGAAHLSMWLVLLASVHFTRTGQIEPVYIPALILMTLACFEAVIPLPSAFQQLGQMLSSASRLFHLVDESKAINLHHSEQLPSAENIQEEANDWEVEVRNVSYQYEQGREYALHNLSLTLKPGRRIAVVGESGAGKSTLLQLLLGLRECTEGTIRLNGRELQGLPDAFIRSQYSVVSQEVHLFNASVAANLRLGCPEATYEQLRQAARWALIDDTIMNLPQGYDTVIGERGGLLSGGERQRLALARALLRRTPALLLDEPVTGLDVLTEQAFMSNLERIWKQKAVVWITHKLSGLDRMDEILVMHNGEVKERGTHKQLLRLEGYYYRLWQLEKEKDCLFSSFHKAEVRDNDTLLLA